MNKKILSLIVGLGLLISCSDSANSEISNKDIISVENNVSKQNLLRAMQLYDQAAAVHFTGDGMAMGRYYNPYLETLSEEKGSVWMYTSAIEAVNGILKALDAQKNKGEKTLYDEHFERYTKVLAGLYSNADYYLGTFELVSFTQTKEWSVYAVDRVGEKGAANVTGIFNVYDDQMWLVRELIESYELTGEKAYLTKAEYLTEYVLDGWDTTIDENGKENGGIPWGPGYTTKHACSNAPMVSPLVWLYEIYKGKSDKIEHRYIDAADKKTRKVETVSKADHYLNYAKKVYEWQKSSLMSSHGVYSDMMGGCVPNCDVAYEEVAGVKYRANTKLTDAVGAPLTYNSGTMVSGGVDLYRATKDAVYLNDAKALSDASYNYFIKPGLNQNVEGYYTMDISGFNNWFNGVLMRSLVEIAPQHAPAADYLKSYQANLDYGYSNFLYKKILPTNLLVGWSYDKGKSNTEGMFSFSYVAEYALLSKFELDK